MLSPSARVFEDLQVFWRATFSRESLSLFSNGVNLTTQLLQTSGIAICRRGETICMLTLEVLDDEVRGRCWTLGKPSYNVFVIFLTLKGDKLTNTRINYKKCSGVH